MTWFQVYSNLNLFEKSGLRDPFDAMFNTMVKQIFDDVHTSVVLDKIGFKPSTQARFSNEAFLIRDAITRELIR